MRILMLLLAALRAAPAAAQHARPSRPLTWRVAYPPGALTDALARAVSGRLLPALGQPIVVENRPGAGTLRTSGARVD
ncbi:MAG: hypothetical protein OEW21_03060 [Betaproteobacteria bacterium]|nr:hypothetical protein [Betaproteobacteria bacterium]